jgi:hypothetical protein
LKSFSTCPACTSSPNVAMNTCTDFSLTTSPPPL